MINEQNDINNQKSPLPQDFNEVHKFLLQNIAEENSKIKAEDKNFFIKELEHHSPSSKKNSIKNVLLYGPDFYSKLKAFEERWKVEKEKDEEIRVVINSNLDEEKEEEIKKKKEKEELITRKYTETKKKMKKLLFEFQKAKNLIKFKNSCEEIYKRNLNFFYNETSSNGFNSMNCINNIIYINDNDKTIYTKKESNNVCETDVNVYLYDIKKAFNRFPSYTRNKFNKAIDNQSFFTKSIDNKSTQSNQIKKSKTVNTSKVFDLNKVGLRSYKNLWTEENSIIRSNKRFIKGKMNSELPAINFLPSLVIETPIDIAKKKERIINSCSKKKNKEIVNQNKSQNFLKAKNYKTNLDFNHFIEVSPTKKSHKFFLTGEKNETKYLNLKQNFTNNKKYFFEDIASKTKIINEKDKGLPKPSLSLRSIDLFKLNKKQNLFEKNKAKDKNFERFNLKPQKDLDMDDIKKKINTEGGTFLTIANDKESEGLKMLNFRKKILLKDEKPGRGLCSTGTGTDSLIDIHANNSFNKNSLKNLKGNKMLKPKLLFNNNKIL